MEILEKVILLLIGVFIGALATIWKDKWRNKYDVKEKNVIKLEENEFLINASESISNVNDELKINIAEDHFSTINGWVLELFGYIPKIGEKMQWNNFEIEIESVDTKKIKRIILRKKENVL